MKKNVIVGQSGGPTAVINASLYGVVQEALDRPDVCGTVYGMINGIEGFLNDRIMDMEPLKQSGLPDPIWDLAGISFRRIWKMKCTQDCLKS